MEREDLFSLADLEGKHILDVGAGPFAALAAQDHGCRVTCIDTDAEKLEEYRQEAEESGVGHLVHFEEADGLRLPYGDSTFDAVVSYGTLHHIPSHERERFLKEMARVAEIVIVVEFTEKGFPHTDDEFSRVDLAWLKEALAGIRDEGNLQVAGDDTASAYVLS